MLASERAEWFDGHPEAVAIGGPRPRRVLVWRGAVRIVFLALVIVRVNSASSKPTLPPQTAFTSHRGSEYYTIFNRISKTAHHGFHGWRDAHGLAVVEALEPQPPAAGLLAMLELHRSSH